jgi:cytochrome P450
VILGIIEQRRNSGGDQGDLLSMLLLAQDEDDGGQMTDRQVRDEAVTLFLAGHETTANTLAWTFYLLAKHPEVAAKLTEVLDRVLGGRKPTLQDLGQLTYTEWVIKEAMRLYPPAWALNIRTPQVDVEIDGYTIPKGSSVFISPYVMHHDPRYFAEPEAFKPERWANDFEKTLPRYVYFPFGGGPRVCIGNSFAMMEARLILADIAQQFEMTVADTVVPQPLITLRPCGEIRATIKPRVKVGMVS